MGVAASRRDDEFSLNTGLRSPIIGATCGAAGSGYTTGLNFASIDAEFDYPFSMAVSASAS